MQYLAHFDTPGGPVCQGVVQFPAAPRTSKYYPDRWFRAVSDLVSAHHGIEGSQVSLRSNLRRGRLDQALLFHAPVEHETRLRHYLASFLELLALADDSVLLPINRATHDELTRVWASRLCRLEPMDLRAGTSSSWLACDFRVADCLPELLAEAAAADVDFFHQINLQTWELPTEYERRTRHNLVALEQMRGMSSELRALQTRLLTRPSGPALLADEFVGVSSVEAAQWLRRVLSRQFAQRFASVRFEMPETTFEETSNEPGLELSEQAAAGLHSALLVEPRDYEVASTILTQVQAANLFNWAGPLRRWFEPLRSEEKAAVRADHDATEKTIREEAARVAEVRSELVLPVCRAPSDYVFVSYRHADFPRITPVLQQIASSGYPLWFDCGIPGSTEWNAVLEERLAHCRLFLLFLSQAAVDSKYVRREVLYADARGKPILSVQLEQPELRHGMGLLLSQYQMVSASAADFFEHIRHAWA